MKEKIQVLFMAAYIDILRSIRGFFNGIGDGTIILQRGHLGLLFDIST